MSDVDKLERAIELVHDALQCVVLAAQGEDVMTALRLIRIRLRELDPASEATPTKGPPCRCDLPDEPLWDLTCGPCLAREAGR